MKTLQKKQIEFVWKLVASQGYLINLSFFQIAFITQTSRTTARRYFQFLAEQGIVKIYNASSNKQYYRFNKSKVNSFIHAKR